MNAWVFNSIFTSSKLIHGQDLASEIAREEEKLSARTIYPELYKRSNKFLYL